MVARDTADVDRRVRTFRFARIRSADSQAEEFAYPSPNEYDPEVLRRDSMGIWLGAALGFGEGAEVLEPEELREKIAERLRGAAKSYEAEAAVQEA